MENSSQQDRFLALYQPVHNRFERFCRARVYGKMEHQDLMNETLLLAYQKFDSLKSEDAFLSFIIGISVRILSNQHKKIKEASFPEAVDWEVPDADANTGASTEIYLLYKAMDLLPEEQKEGIILFEIMGFSIKEIMEIQHASASAVKQRLKRGREKLEEILTFESTITKGGEHGNK